jgi:hypothetical protein
VTRVKWGMYGKSTNVNDKVSGKNLSGPVIIEKARYETFRMMARVVVRCAYPSEGLGW